MYAQTIHLRSLVTIGTTVVALACAGGTTEPPPAAKGPQYELVTSFATFTYIIGPCPGGSPPYCYETVPAGEARLVGTLPFPFASTDSARLQRHLHSVDPNEPGPQTYRVAEQSIYPWDSTMYLVIGAGADYISLSGTMAGDSISGNVHWTTTPARRYYQGTFVLRRKT